MGDALKYKMVDIYTAKIIYNIDNRNTSMAEYKMNENPILCDTNIEAFDALFLFNTIVNEKYLEKVFGKTTVTAEVTIKHYSNMLYDNKVSYGIVNTSVYVGGIGKDTNEYTNILIDEINFDDELGFKKYIGAIK